MEYIQQAEQEFEKVLSFMHDEIATMRSGRAHPGLVDGIVVNSYGAQTPLSQVATVNTADAKSLTIQPWDRGLLGEVEKAIRESDIGINPVNDGIMIRLVLPQMTEESRKDLIKILHQKLEKTRISIRQWRDKTKEDIIKAEKNKEITEDDRFDLLKKLDEKTSEFNSKIKESGEKKEEEIMTV